ncbi:hypothetical protein F5Y07DRAFT_212658 [Xylaria sp. FL0933]|nr:hypothetical protein F5Y07DRAFT_212658 [Xylaria sp. FL0933]
MPKKGSNMKRFPLLPAVRFLPGGRIQSLLPGETCEAGGATTEDGLGGFFVAPVLIARVLIASILLAHMLTARILTARILMARILMARILIAHVLIARIPVVRVIIRDFIYYRTLLTHTSKLRDTQARTINSAPNPNPNPLFRYSGRLGVAKMVHKLSKLFH